MEKRMAVYAPKESQGKNLLKLLGNRENITNNKEKDSQKVSDLTASIIGKELHAKIQDVFDKKTWHEYNLWDKSTYPKETDSLVVFIRSKYTNSKGDVISDYIFKLNENHPDIKNAFKKLSDGDASLAIDSDFIVIDEYTHLSPLDFLILEKYSKLYNNIKPKIVYTNTLDETFALTDSGKADFGFVSLSQVLNKPNNLALQNVDTLSNNYLILPKDSYPPILQDGIILNHPETSQIFVDYLKSAKAQDVLTDAGFLPICTSTTILPACK